MNRVKPTEKQRKTFELKMQNPDMPLGKAMELAEYKGKSPRTPGKNFLESRGVDVLREEYRNHLTELGLGTAKIAQKMAEWLDAEKPFSSHTEPDKLVPDYQTQLRAGEMLREDLGIMQVKGINLNLLNTGEMTLEFIDRHESNTT